MPFKPRFEKNKVSIEEAKYMFKILIRRRNVIQYKMKYNIRKNKILILSNLFERDIFSSETCGLDSIFLLGRNNLLISKDLFLILTPQQRFALYIGYLFARKRILEFSDLIYFFTKTGKWIIGFTLSLIDAIFIVLLALKSILFRRVRKSTNNEFKPYVRIDELYVICYWSTKCDKSTAYYYPDYSNNQSKIALATSFYQYRFIARGIYSSSKRNNIITCIDFVRSIDLVRSIRDLAYIHSFEISNLINLSYGELVSIIDTYRHLNKRLFALINYHSISSLITNIRPKEIYLWSENQLHHRALALALSKFKPLSNFNKILVHTYIGSPFSNRYYPHFVPTKMETKCGVWAQNKFMLQDKSSAEEMETLLSKHDIPFSVRVARKGLIRYKDNIKESTNFNTNKNKKRIYTFFSHANPRELYLILLLFIREQHRNFQEINNLKLYIRLHPAISQDTANEQIKMLEKLFIHNLPQFIFIQRGQESVVRSMLLSQNCIFGESSYINIAISLGCEVTAIRTSYQFDPPIQAKNLKYKKLTII